MARGNKRVRKAASGLAPTQTTSKSYRLAERGVDSSESFKGLMLALMTDTVMNRVSPQVTNAACNAGGRAIKVVELEFKYGGKGSSGRRLALTA